MPDIFHHFPVRAPARKIFDVFATAAGLDTWWTKHASGSPQEGAEYLLDFGSGHEWRAVVSRYVSGQEFELQLTRADDDWLGTRVGVSLEEKNGMTNVRFHHTGWPESNEHYRVSCYCWAMYLRLLKRQVEFSEFVPYEQRLDV